MQGHEGSGRGLAGLARAQHQDPVSRRSKQLSLPGIRRDSRILSDARGIESTGHVNADAHSVDSTALASSSSGLPLAALAVMSDAAFDSIACNAAPTARAASGNGWRARTRVARRSR